ncbi:MAG TPA: LuxR C-terminal-related transcriptional regulator [Hanamia sp.]|nr:LuxR C-terminal-related transcriptional regulator [Hanamia sp.]
MLKLVEAKEQTVVQEYKIKSLLTKREIEVLKLIANELTNQEIGKKLFISSKAVQSHKQNVFIKLQVKNSAGLVKKAIKMGAD